MCSKQQIRAVDVLGRRDVDAPDVASPIWLARSERRRSQPSQDQMAAFLQDEERLLYIATGQVEDHIDARVEEVFSTVP
jgi:hypothetical protein